MLCFVGHIHIINIINQDSDILKNCKKIKYKKYYYILVSNLLKSRTYSMLPASAKTILFSYISGSYKSFIQIIYECVGLLLIV